MLEGYPKGRGFEGRPLKETQGEHDGRHLHPQHMALRAYLDHREIFDQAIDFRAFVQPSSPAEFNGAREGVDCRHDDPDAWGLNNGAVRKL